MSTTDAERSTARASPLRLGLAGAAVMGVAFGMARYIFGLTLPDIRSDLGISNLTLGFVGSATYAGYLAGLLLVVPVSGRWGPRAPTTLGGAFGAAGCFIVGFAPSTGWLAVGAVLAGSAAGWVWSPYSDLVVRSTELRHHARLLALITTGCSAGLATAGLLDLLIPPASWRGVWLATGVAAVAAGALNLAWVPRLAPRPHPPRGSRPPGTGDVEVGRRGSRLPALGYAALYFGTCVVYLTYASDAARSAGLPASAGALLFILLSVTGLAALFTAPFARAVSTPVVAGASLGSMAAALVLLATADTQGEVLLSAAVFGPGYMIGAACLPIWTAELDPEHATRVMTVAITVGGLTAAGSPAIVGSLHSTWGLSATLVATAVIGAAGGVLVAVVGLAAGHVAR